ncbi:DNA-3-methyladenine glycosylase family protein [Roseimaritima sediminicola]|uniref:DNA-3-methyladenine glycosylase family protein n=1 Tax=Roseimaritima sediminicola TaxID=2662066 RepID=UPI0012984D11|nr:DNA-3-methyladenine glycosylase [Roseimaritima sediminicola]
MTPADPETPAAPETPADPERLRLQRRFVRQLRRGEKHLVAQCHRLGPWVTEAGRSTWQVDWDRDLYQALVRSIAYQQLHANAARAILQRFEDSFRGNHFPTPHQVRRASEEKLRAVGFSATKAAAVGGIARAAARGELPTREQAAEMSDEALIEQLIRLRGVGRWTVEMLLIFTLGRMDVMPVDDFGVKSGLAALHDLPKLPARRQFAELTDHWQPYRSLGAWYLWRLADTRKAK